MSVRTEWTPDKCKEGLERFIREHGRLPIELDLRNINGLPASITFKKVTGQSLREYLETFFPEAECLHSWSKERCIDALVSFVKRSNRFPDHLEMKESNGLPSAVRFKQMVGITPRQYLYQEMRELYDAYDSRPSWSKKSILTALDQFVEDHGRRPSYRELNSRHGLPEYNSIKRITGVRYQELCLSRYAQYHSIPRRKPEKWSKERCMEAVDWFVNSHERIPTTKEIQTHPQLPSGQTFKIKMGCSVFEYCKIQYPELPIPGGKPEKWSNERCMEAVDWFVSSHERIPTIKEIQTHPQLPSGQTFKIKVGCSVFEYCQIQYPELPSSARKAGRPSLKDKCENALNDFAQREKRIPQDFEYTEENGLPTQDVLEKVGIDLDAYWDENFPNLCENEFAYVGPVLSM